MARGHAGLRAESAPTSAPKRTGGFASVLAAVQEQDEPSIAVPEDGRRASATDRVVPSERDASDRAGESGAVEHVVVDEPPAPAPAPTPWLLLSLSSGPHVWNNGSQSSPEDLGDATDAAVDVATTGPQAVAVIPADPGATTTAVPLLVAEGVPHAGAAETFLAGAPAPLASVSAGGSVAPQDAPSDVEPGATPLDALAAAGLPVTAALEVGGPIVALAAVATKSDPAAGLAGADVAVEVPSGAPAGRPALAAAPTAEPPASGLGDDQPSEVVASRKGTTFEAPLELARQDERPARSSTMNDTLGRWLTANRRAGGDVEVRPPGVAETPAAPGLAIRQLAHVLGTAQHGDVTDAVSPDVPLTPEVLLSAVGGAMPTARASEVLLRLAQAGAPVSRSGRDPQAPTAMAVQMLSSALAPSPLSEPVVAPAPTAPLPPAVGDQVMQQVVQSLRMQWKDGIGEAKVHLRPDALGAVSVTLRVEGGAVTAVVRAESPQVQEWVLQHQQTLRQQMEAAGLRLDELVVSPDDQRAPDQQQKAPPDQRRRSRGPRADEPADSTRFEGLL